MALFSDNRARPRRPKRVRTGWSLLLVALVGTLVLSLVPTPYVIEQPGPVFDTLGEVEVSGKDVPLISIDSETTYPTTGTLSMLTVSVLGNREEHPSWFEVVSAWADPSRAVVPVDAVYPLGETLQQSNKQSAVDMQNSQKDAVAAALADLGYSFTSTLTIAELSPDSPAEATLRVGDVIESVNGKSPADVTALRALIAGNGVERAAEIAIQRDGTAQTVAVTPFLPTGDAFGPEPKPVVGISVSANYNFPFEVKIQLENVGGPSAGMMFALGIIDKLTPGSLNGGADVAGTGTISSEGDVGAIGGIRQKLYGAKNAGAEYFLAPASNCDEVVGHIPAGLSVFSVATLDDSLAALDALRSGSAAGVAGLPTCSDAPGTAAR